MRRAGPALLTHGIAGNVSLALGDDSREDRMKFGIFFEISVPRPWDAESERTVYEHCLEQAQLADELGFDTIWVVEHHFMEELSHLSAPDIFLTACAMTTKRIRLGHGIVICVPELNHPIRIAERAATLDILSRGRLELGTGRAFSWNELAGFGANPDTTKKTWDETVRVLPKMWTEERFGYDGLSFSMPRRAILPKPYQKPHPPIWVAVASPGTEIDAGSRGLGFLSLSIGGYDERRKQIARYREAIEHCEPVGKVITNQVALGSFLFCHPDNEYGVETGTRLAAAFGEVAGQVFSTRETSPSPSYGARSQAPGRRRQAEQGDSKAPDGLCAGDPARIIEAVRLAQELGADHMNLILNMMEVIPQEEVLDSLRLFAKEVMPHFRDQPSPAAARTRAGVS